jgi:uncharacterized membrane-anchored protein YhcB (DUF1043 family)
LEQQGKLKQGLILIDIIIGSLVVILILTILVGILKGKRKTKSQIVKKHEIYENYKAQLEDILEKYKDNPSIKIEQKKLFLQKCNSQLSRNIFFDEIQAKQIISKLAKL